MPRFQKTPGRRRKNYYTREQSRRLAEPATDREWEVLLDAYGRNKKDRPHRYGKKSRVDFGMLPVGTYFAEDRPLEKRFPVKGVVFRKISPLQAVSVRKPGTSRPEWFTDEDEREFGEPFEVMLSWPVRVRQAPGR